MNVGNKLYFFRFFKVFFLNMRLILPRIFLLVPLSSSFKRMLLPATHSKCTKTIFSWKIQGEIFHFLMLLHLTWHLFYFHFYPSSTYSFIWILHFHTRFMNIRYMIRGLQDARIFIHIRKWRKFFYHFYTQSLCHSRALQSHSKML